MSKTKSCSDIYLKSSDIELKSSDIELKPFKSNSNFKNFNSKLSKTLSRVTFGNINKSTELTELTELNHHPTHFSPIIHNLENDYENTIDIETGNDNESKNSLTSGLSSVHSLASLTSGLPSLHSLNSLTSLNKENWKKILKQVIHYYTHFLMFIIFEILFYFKYVVEYEKKLVYKMILELTNNAIEYANFDISKYKKCDFYNQVCDTFVNGKTDELNVAIYDNALYLIFGMSGFLIFLIVIETNMFQQKSTFPKEFCKSLLLMIFVGLFDYLFFKFFILKYKIINTGELMCYLYEHDNNGCKSFNSSISYL